MVELNDHLMPVDSPIALNQGLMTAMEFDSKNDPISKIRNAAIGSAQIQDAAIGNAQLGTAIIGTANIGTLSFNEITGGTATLGGTLNGNGLLIVKDSTGTTAVTLNNSQLQIYDSAGKRQFLLNYADGYLQLNSVRVGGTSVTQSGAIFLYDSGNLNFGELSVDRFYFGVDTYIGTDNPLILEGTAVQSAPSGTNQCSLYVSNTSGTTQLFAKFSSGTAVVLATRP